MQIRTRLTLQFLLIGGFIMILASSAIYYSSAVFRKADFYERMFNKARSTSKLLLEEKIIDPERVLNIEKDNPFNLQSERITVFNFLNDTVYTSDLRREIKVSNELLERVRLGENVTFRQNNYEVLGTLYTARFDRFVVIIAAIDSQGLMHLKKLRLILIIVSVISIVVFYVIGWFYTGRALKPISDVVGNVEEISISSLHLRVPEGNGTDEIGKLAITFNKMLDRLEKSFAMQKDFIANASHELRTPLTSINGQLEVLVLKERTTPEYKAVLASVLEDIKSLIDISNRLLIIARTSYDQTINLESKIRIDEVLWQASEEILKFNGEYRVSILMDPSVIDSDRMLVNGDESLLKAAFTNIMDNGCKYSPDHFIEISFGYTESMVELVFTDRGIGIPEDELKKVFEPFYRGSNAVSMPGSGIGLQLVNQIILKHKGNISLESALDRGTTVKVTLPLAT
jgi:signal transduction histidine kinase